jgi:hypothetical protein
VVGEDGRRLRADVGMAQGMSSGMEYESIVARDAKEQRDREIEKARRAMGELKRARLVEGPTDTGVMEVSKRVDMIVTERERARGDNEEYFDATKILATDELKERIKSSIKKDNDALFEAF